MSQAWILNKTIWTLGPQMAFEEILQNFDRIHEYDFALSLRTWVTKKRKSLLESSNILDWIFYEVLVVSFLLKIWGKKYTKHHLQQTNESFQFKTPTKSLYITEDEPSEAVCNEIDSFLQNLVRKIDEQTEDHMLFNDMLRICMFPCGEELKWPESFLNGQFVELFRERSHVKRNEDLVQLLFEIRI